MRDLFLEIYGSISRNKLRTSLTGFAVAWGIFMLIVLLGTGNGLKDMFNADSEGISTNTMSVYGGFTSKPYAGYQQGRRIRLDESDVDLVGNGGFASYIDKVTMDISRNVTLVNGKQTASATIEATSPDLPEMQKIEILHGRFVNDNDMKESRKVMVLPEKTAAELLPPGTLPESIVGKHVKAGGVMFKVVGIVKSNDMMFGNTAYAPFPTVRTIWAKGKELDGFTFTFHGLETEEENKTFTNELRHRLNLRHDAAPDDFRAIWISNHFLQNMQMGKAFNLLNIGLLIIGLFTLLSGIVGVSNIMLITVKERTHEFGIRKAIGATPFALTKLIITESVTITAIFGYIGMFLGMVACKIIGKMLANNTPTVMGETVSLNLQPSVSLDIALEATLILVIAGTVAGLIPALRAAKVRPIEALRAE